MSNMKCPICQNNLHKINIMVSTCTNDKCKLWGWSIPNLVLEALAQAKQDLERTRKALDVAKRSLEDCNKILSADMKDWEYLTADIALKQIEQITTAEQKD